MQKLSFEGLGMNSRRTREKLIQRLKDQGITDNDVLDVMLNTPRHLFLDEVLAYRAYDDVSLPIGFNQTLSQPYIVARMTELLLRQGPLSRVLEIGTGSGYQTAVLSQLVERVYSIERIKSLQQKARERLRKLKIKNVHFYHSDGCLGFELKAPYDGIITTAAPAEVPLSLLEQLAVGGRLIIPVGEDNDQHLNVIVRTETGFERQIVEPVKFVELKSGLVS